MRSQRMIVPEMVAFMNLTDENGGLVQASLGALGYLGRGRNLEKNGRGGMKV